MIRPDEVGFVIPLRGMPDRRRAIARAALEVVVMALTAGLLLAVFLGSILLVWAAMLPVPQA